MAAAQTTTPIARRGLLAAVPLVAVPSAIAAEPDAELIVACRRFMAARDACELGGRHEDADSCPLYAAMDDAETAALAIPAQSLAGVLAKAEVAQFLAARASSWDSWETAFVGSWPEAALRDLLRLYQVGGRAKA